MKKAPHMRGFRLSQVMQLASVQFSPRGRAGRAGASSSQIIRISMHLRLAFASAHLGENSHVERSGKHDASSETGL
jgi:hypothetical protein